MHANDREDVDEVYAGDIAAAVGIKQVVTGDTLCAPDQPVRLENIDFPEPVIKVAVEPKTKVDQEKMGIALQRLAEEDPTFQVADQRGDRPDRDLRHGRAAPRDPRRPHEARVQGRGQRRPPAGLLPRDHQGRPPRRSRAASSARPAARASSASSTSTSSRRPARASSSSTRSSGGSIPTEFIPAVEKGIEEALENGVKAGYPLVDVRATLVDGKFHDTDSSEIAFKIAGSLALPGGGQAREADPARADLRGRGRHPRGVPRRRHRRPEPPARSRRGPGPARQRAGRHGQGPAVGDVRLRDRPALQHPGPRQLHDAVRQLRRGAARTSPRRSSASAPESLTPPSFSTFHEF